MPRTEDEETDGVRGFSRQAEIVETDLLIALSTGGLVAGIFALPLAVAERAARIAVGGGPPTIQTEDDPEGLNQFPSILLTSASCSFA